MVDEPEAYFTLGKLRRQQSNITLGDEQIAPEQTGGGIARQSDNSELSVTTPPPEDVRIPTPGATGMPIVGIWKYEYGQLVLCSNEAAMGFPRGFDDGEQRDLLTLWMR
jgi:hypothetical protein